MKRFSNKPVLNFFLTATLFVAAPAAFAQMDCRNVFAPANILPAVSPEFAPVRAWAQQLLQIRENHKTHGTFAYDQQSGAFESYLSSITYTEGPAKLVKIQYTFDGYYLTLQYQTHQTVQYTRREIEPLPSGVDFNYNIDLMAPNYGPGISVPEPRYEFVPTYSGVEGTVTKMIYLSRKDLETASNGSAGGAKEFLQYVKNLDPALHAKIVEADSKGLVRVVVSHPYRGSTALMEARGLPQQFVSAGDPLVSLATEAPNFIRPIRN